MTPLILAGSGIAVLALAGAAWLMRLGSGVRLMRSPAEAIDAAAEAASGFHAVDAVVSDDGRAALAIDPDRRVLAIKLHGARPAARTVPWSALRQTYDGIVVETGDRRFGTVTVVGVSALDMRRLGSPTTDEPAPLPDPVAA